jgi:cobalamin biosynthesis Mg chelatase CobN
MNIRIGIWAGGDSSNDEGTIEWAGGETDYAQGPFTMVLEKVEVVNENPGGIYAYGDMTGDYTSIKVNDADSTGGDADTSQSSSASTEPSSEISSASTSSSRVSGGSPTATVAASASSTQTGMWWTARASASSSAVLSKAATSPAMRLSVDVWQYGMLGLLILQAIVW